MKQPLQSKEEIESRLSRVEFFIKNPTVKNIIQNELRKIPDLDLLYYVFYKVKAGKNKANVAVNDLIKIYRTIKTLREMINNLEEKADQNETLE